jgi:hypothetical protein
MKNEISATRNVASARVERALRDFMQQPKSRSRAGVGELAATFNQISEDHEQCIPEWVLRTLSAPAKLAGDSR